jgi:hypothetical protein
MRKKWVKAAAVAFVVFGGYFVLEALLTGSRVPLGALALAVLGALGCVLVRRDAALERAEAEMELARTSLRDTSVTPQPPAREPVLKVIKGGKES